MRPPVNIDLARDHDRTSDMRLLRLYADRLPQLRRADLAPGGADQRAVRPERQRQDQPARGGVAAGPRPRACAARATPICHGTAGPAAGRSPAASPRRTARSTSAPARRPPATEPVPRPEPRNSPGVPPGRRRAAQPGARSPPASPRSGSRRRWTGCSRKALSGRRRFLDRLVWALEPGHAREVAAHDAAMAQRNRLLAEGRARPRPGWPAWRMPWRGMPWRPRPRAWPWSPG